MRQAWIISCLAIATAAVNAQSGPSCLPPVPVPHGFYTLGSESTNVTYGCDSGYIAAGESQAACVDGSWSAAPPSCVASGCDGPSALAHGYITMTYGGTVAHFRCDEGRTLHGPEVIVCDGAFWNGTQPICRAAKKHGHNNPRHAPRSSGARARHHRRGQEDLLEADYSCIEQGLVVRPPGVANSMRELKWAVVKGRPRLYIVYRCRWGFTLAGRAKTLYCQERQWVGKTPKCVTEVPSVASVSNIQEDDANTSPRTHEDWVRYSDYSCFTAHNQVSAPVVENALRLPRFQSVDGYPHMYVQYDCHAGYAIQDGDQYLYCNREKWHGQTPTCRPDPNDADIIPDCSRNNADCQHVCTMEKGLATCSCKSGYRLGDDGQSCHDINECDTDNGGCVQLCVNTEGYFRCDCRAGFRLSLDGHSCLANIHTGSRRDRPPLVLFHA